MELASIATYGENVHTFVNRDLHRPLPARYAWVDEAGRRPVWGYALDHVVGNVELGRMNHWVEFYERTLGFTELIRFFARPSTPSTPR